MHSKNMMNIGNILNDDPYGDDPFAEPKGNFFSQSRINKG